MWGTLSFIPVLTDRPQDMLELLSVVSSPGPAAPQCSSPLRSTPSPQNQAGEGRKCPGHRVLLCETERSGGGSHALGEHRRNSIQHNKTLILRSNPNWGM